MKILNANDNPAVRQAGSYRNWIASITLQRWGVMPTWATGGAPRPAFIQRSQWAVACDVCTEQVITAPGEPFFCPNCCNVKNGGKARLVAWPHNRDGIEALLVRRADPRTRNWWPDNAIRGNGGWLLGETLRDLIREQEQHGEL